MNQKIRLVTKGTQTRIWVDDKEIRGVVNATFAYEPNAIPLVYLIMNALDIEIEADDSKIIMQKEQKDD